MTENNCVLGLSTPKEKSNIKPLERYKEISKELVEHHKELGTHTLTVQFIHDATMQILNLEIFS